MPYPMLMRQIKRRREQEKDQRERVRNNYHYFLRNLGKRSTSFTTKFKVPVVNSVHCPCKYFLTIISKIFEYGPGSYTTLYHPLKLRQK